jgi:hypothetical protein
MAKIDVRLEHDTDYSDCPVLLLTVTEPDLVGKQADLSFVLKVHVHDSRAVHNERVVHRHSFALSAGTMRVELPKGCLHGFYSYAGKGIDLRVVAKIKIDDGILFDSEVETQHPLPLGDRPRVAAHDGKLMDPSDAFSFIANLNAIPPKNKMITLWLMLIGGVLIVVNALLGLHDQFVPESQIYFYDHTGDDGSESPLMKALMGCGALGVALWAAIKAQLRKYMRFELRPCPPLRRGVRLNAAELVDGEARTALHDITVRVVACNRECGQYKRGSGTKVRTVSFKTPSRAVKLYEKRIANVPANVPIAQYLDGEIDFEPMFADLYPPLMIATTHGIDVAWEVQLLHPKFVDQELPCNADGLRYDDFLDP